MKTLNKIILGLSLAIGSATYAVEPPPVDANVNVTRDRIKQVVDQLLLRGNGINFNVSDYRTWAPIFKQRVNDALEEYEKTMQTEILPTATLWANRYNEVANSKSYNSSQKELLLRSLDSQADGSYAGLSKQHSEALEKVYKAVFGDLNIGLKFSDSVSAQIKTRKKDPQYYRHQLDYTYTYNGQSIIFTMVVKNETSSTAYQEPKYKCIDLIYSASTDLWRQKKARFLTSMILPESTDPANYESIIHQYRKKDDVKLESAEERAFCFTSASKSYVESTYNYGNSNYDNFQKDSYRFLPGLIAGREHEVFEELVYPIIKEPCQSSMCLSLVAGDLNFARGLIKSAIDQPITITLNKFKKVIGNSNIGIQELTELFSRVDYPNENLPFDTN